MELTLQDHVEIPESVVFRELGGEMVILNLESTVYFGLDAVGARIWTLVQQHGSLAKVFQMLQMEFQAEPALLQKDLLDLTNQFCEKGLVRIAVPQP
jgi:hypothetical protein